MMQDDFIGTAAVIAMLPVTVSKDTLTRWARSGAFPKAVRVTTKILVWRRDDVTAWIAERWPTENKYTKRDPEKRHAKKAARRGPAKA
jgi:predicted DNA-binding transcriptional regulator AlpA